MAYPFCYYCTKKLLILHFEHLLCIYLYSFLYVQSPMAIATLVHMISNFHIMFAGLYIAVHILVAYLSVWALSLFACVYQLKLFNYLNENACCFMFHFLHLYFMFSQYSLVKVCMLIYITLILLSFSALMLTSSFFAFQY